MSVHLWYLYAIIGLYAFIPLLRKVYSGTTDAEKRFYLVMWFFVAAIYPIVRSYFQLSLDVISVYNMGTFSGFIGYFFLGAYLFDIKTNNCNSAKWFFVFMISNFITMIMTYTYSISTGSPNELFYSYLSPFVVIAASATFILRTQNHIMLNDWQNNTLKIITQYSLGIYCVHFMILEVLEIIGLSGSVGSAWWSIPVTAVSALIVSFVIIGLLRRFFWMRNVT